MACSYYLHPDGPITVESLRVIGAAIGSNPVPPAERPCPMVGVMTDVLNAPSLSGRTSIQHHVEYRRDGESGRPGRHTILSPILRPACFPICWPASAFSA